MTGPVSYPAIEVLYWPKIVFHFATVLEFHFSKRRELKELKNRNYMLMFLNRSVKLPD